MLVIDGCDDAVIGFVDGPTQDGVTRMRAAYSYEKLVQVFIDQGMDYHEAREWVEFNIMGAYLGIDTPVIVQDGDRETLDELAGQE